MKDLTGKAPIRDAALELLGEIEYQQSTTRAAPGCTVACQGAGRRC